MPVSAERIRSIIGHVECEGTRVVIHEQLDRAEYQAVNKVFTNLGGAWSRRDKAHLFEQPPTEQLRRIVEDGWMPRSPRTAEGFVRTPPELAAQIVRDHLDEYTDVPIILEPSAGDGALVRAILDAEPEAAVTAIEPNRERAQALEQLDCQVVTAELEDIAEQQVGRYDAVVANPPFSTDGNANLWIDHVHLAWRMLRPGGKLISIAPSGFTFRDDRRHRLVRQLITEHGGWHELPDGSFAESGTTVRTVLLWADKPAEDAPVERKKKGKPSDEEKQQRRDDDAELRTEASERLDDEQWAARMEARIASLPPDCRLSTYSPRNQALVLMQALEKDVEVTGHLNTFRGWAQQGRIVQAGQSALRIVAAMGQDEETTENEQGEQEKQVRNRFRMTTRFDLSQTKAMDLDEGGESE